MIDTIEVVIGFPRHRKTRRLERILGNDARWLPIYLWLYTLENAKDSGDLSHLTPEDLAAVLDYHADATALRAALVTAEFLDAAGHVVGWSERYAQRFAFYGRRAKAAAERRWGKVATPDQKPTEPLPPAPPTLDKRPDLTGPDLTLSSIAKHSSSMLVASQAEVDAIYQAYPRHVAKADALKAIARTLKAGAITPADLLAKVQAYAAATAQWPTEERQYIPYPASWINAGQFNDDPTNWTRTASNHAKPLASPGTRHAAIASSPYRNVSD